MDNDTCFFHTKAHVPGTSYHILLDTPLPYSLQMFPHTISAIVTEARLHSLLHGADGFSRRNDELVG